MGNSSSHTHVPLERGYTRDAYGDIINTVCLLKFFICFDLITTSFYSSFIYLLIYV